jgi:hypothetical protein
LPRFFLFLHSTTKQVCCVFFVHLTNK